MMNATFLSTIHRRVDSALWETVLGVDTRRAVFGSPTDGGHHYSPLPYLFIRRMIDCLGPRPDDVLVDIGSGKGRVICVASRYPMRRVVGIEVNHQLVEIARDNGRRVRGKRTEIELVESPGQNYSYADTTLVVMYSPFDERTMEQVFARFDASYRVRPRRIRIAYANCAFEAPLENTSWLRKVEEWGPFSVGGFPHKTSFWESDVR